MASSSSSSSSSSDPLLQVDDFYFSLLLFSDDNEDEIIFPISDEMYAESLSLQEALMSSVVTVATTSSTHMSASVTYTNNNKLEQKDIGESSSSQLFCGICMEGKQTEEMFVNTCSHSFCSDCVGRHIAAKLQEGITVTCPEPTCKVIIEPYACQSIVPAHVFERWGDALCESVIQGYQKLYCPYNDCSAMFVDDGGEVITQTECLHCRRLFCVQCMLPWHSDMQCEDFQRLGLNERSGTDLMLISLAKEKNWRRCPSCKIYVEKKEGCLHMTCRCRFEFCYSCGATWSSSHGGCVVR